MISYKYINEETSLQERPHIKEYSSGKFVDLFSACKLYISLSCFVMLIYLIYIGCNGYVPIEMNVLLRTDKIVTTVDEKFLSIALDTAFLKDRWRHFNISSEKLLQVTRHLSPGYLRIGGTMADKLIFQEDAESNPIKTIEDNVIKSLGVEDSQILENSETFIMTGEDWKKINNFSKNAGLKLLFDLNVLLRNSDDWNSSNAVQLIKYSDKNGFDVDWQLGNEPNSFVHVFNVSISGSQLAQDFIALKHILNSFPRYSKSLLVGPDVTRPKISDVSDSSIHYLNDFLNHIDNSINVVTWHQYYLNGHIAKLDDFLNPATFNILYEQISSMKQQVQFAHNISRNTPIWLSETGSAYGGGAKSLSDRFVASFLWLDKLGVAARMSVQVVVRQALYHGNYAMLDETNLSPLPDWWLSVMYKKFVSSRVIDTTIFLGPVRIYCHCTPQSSSLAPGTVTIFGLNMGYAEARLTPSVGLKRGHTLSYILTGEFGLQSKIVLLNDQWLNLNEDGNLPNFYPTSVNTPYLSLPPQSIGFFVLHGIVVDACVN